MSGVNLENLWVDQILSVEERVELWYANGSTMDLTINGGREGGRG